MPRTQRKHGKGPRSKCCIGRRYKNKLWGRKETSLDNVSARLEDERESSEDNRDPLGNNSTKDINRPPEEPPDSSQPPEGSNQPTEDNGQPPEENVQPPEDNSQPSNDRNWPLADNTQPLPDVSVSLHIGNVVNEELSHSPTQATPTVPVFHENFCSEAMQLQASVQESLDSCVQLLTLNRLPEGWFFSQSTSPQVELKIFETFRQFHLKPLIILRLLLIRQDLSWEVYVADHAVPHQCGIISQFPSSVNSESLLNLINAVSSASICQGNFADRYVAMARMRKGIFTSQCGEVVAYLDQSFCVVVSGEQHSATIRHAKCELLVVGNICALCYGFRDTLRSLFSKLRKRSIVPSVYTNTRFLKTPQKSARIKSLQKAIRIKTRQLKQLRMRINSILETNGVAVADDLRGDLEKVVENHKVMEEDEFKRVFWEQQVAACKAKKTGVRWHPLFIRWCLNIMLTSSKTYQIIRESGFICLPSQRTLKDYTHWTKLQPGFNADLFNHMMKEAAKVDQMKDWERYVVLVLDEMKIRTDLVFNKTSGEIMGFVDYGEGTLEHKFTELQEQCKQQKLADRELATHMLTVMVRGLTFHLDLPIAHFATTGATAEQLMPVVWRAIRMLQLAGLTVVSVVADGASSNRKFFRLHKILEHQKSGVTYKAPNISRNGHFVYLMPDAPHLLKTIRNAWYNSQSKRTRNLINDGHEIKWAHLVELCEKSVADTGLYIGKKLTREHVQLTSYSRMNVLLAAQVLSTSVANGFHTLRTLNESTLDTTATEKFCRIFDKFFDICNTRSVDEHKIKKKPNVCPFYEADDERLKWLEDILLKYLDDWQKWVEGNEEIPAGAKKYCLLPDQTIEGIKICVHSLREVIKFLLGHDGIKFVLTERFNQDPLEVFFGQQRSRGCRNDNPSMKQCLENAQALVVQKSLACGGSSNITNKRKNTGSSSPLSRPLSKRRCRRLNLT